MINLKQDDKQDEEGNKMEKDDKEQDNKDEEDDKKVGSRDDDDKEVDNTNLKIVFNIREKDKEGKRR